MTVKQLSVFIENRQGRLGEVLAVLKHAHVNILSMCVADTTEYGLLRLIVNDPEKGKDALAGGEAELDEKLAAAGVDILDPLQPCCEEMHPENLQAKHGGKLAFHGGIDVQGVLVNGTPDEVRKTVARYRGAFGEKGYICCPSHLFQIDTPVENMQALYEEIIRPKY